MTVAKAVRDIELSAWIHAPAWKVFDALTESQGLASWLAAKASSEPRPRGELKLTWEGLGTGEYRFLKLAPDREVELSWEKGARVHFRLEAEGDGTHVRLTLHDVPCEGEELACYTNMASGWTANLAKLKCWLERGWDLRKGQPSGSCLA